VAALVLDDARQLREAFMSRHAIAVYDRLTGRRSRLVRLHELAGAASLEFPGLVPTAAEVEDERQFPQMHQDGIQIDQGIFFAHILADRLSGSHLLHAMSQPTAAALAELERFRATGRLELVPMTLERQGRLGRITFHHRAWLNAEDDDYVEALETLVDLVLLDDGIQVGVLRGAPMTKAKYAGRRVFGAGINLTQLFHGKISLIRFMLNRETGPLSKIYRGLAKPEFRPSDLENGVEKPFIGAVDAFAIGGHCQMLLILDRVIAQRGSYFNLPARKEGIIPGVANLRLPRFVGERATRQGIFFNRAFEADSPAGQMICDELVDGEERMEAAIEAAAADLTSAGTTSLVANRRALRAGAEPIDLFRRYLATYAREQAYCLYSPALIDNLVRNWSAQERSISPAT
jgi:(3,5-dihydroxyphenyl)acetyl-CoA 1,2-dioxygenase